MMAALMKERSGRLSRMFWVLSRSASWGEDLGRVGIRVSRLKGVAALGAGEGSRPKSERVLEKKSKSFSLDCDWKLVDLRGGGRKR